VKKCEEEKRQEADGPVSIIEARFRLRSSHFANLYILSDLAFT